MNRVLLAVAGALVAAAAPASAETVTFSQVTQQTAAKPFSYTVSGNTTTFKLAGGPLFNFSTLDLFHSVAPIETVTAGLVATSNQALVNAGGNEWTQDFQTGKLTFTLSAARAQALTGNASKTNLLTVDFTNGTLFGKQGNRAPTFSASTPSSTIVYTSDYHDFVVTPDYLAEFSLSLSSAGNSAGLVYNASTRRFANFTASGSGTFGVAVPEPATWAMMIAGFGIAGAAVRRRTVRSAVAFG